MKELGVLNVKNIYNYLARQFMFRYVNKLLPNVFESYFTLSTSVHTYNTTVFISSAILSYKPR